MGKRDGKEIIYFTKDKNNKIRAYKQIVSNGSIEEIQKSLSNEKFLNESEEFYIIFDIIAPQIGGRHGQTHRNCVKAI